MSRQDEQPAADLGTSLIKLGSVVVGVDDAPLVERRAELLYAAAEANRRMADVVLVHGCEPLTTPTSPAPSRSLASRRARGHELLAVAADFLRPHVSSGRSVQQLVANGTGAEILLELSAAASLLVLQRRPISTPRRWHTGSTTARVCAQARCPVAVVTTSGERSVTNGRSRHGVVVAVDARGHCAAALDTAFNEADLRGETLIAVHVWTPPKTIYTYGYVAADPAELADERRVAALELSEALAGHRELHPGVRVSPRVVSAPSVQDAIVDAAQDAAVLVVSRHGQHHTGSLGLGSLARHCLSRAHCPVVVTPASRPRPHSQAAAAGGSGSRESHATG
jgi:nucleotide-binding universal stress UspA family protein